MWLLFLSDVLAAPAVFKDATKQRLPEASVYADATRLDTPNATVVVWAKLSETGAKIDAVVHHPNGGITLPDGLSSSDDGAWSRVKGTVPFSPDPPGGSDVERDPRQTDRLLGWLPTVEGGAHYHVTLEGITGRTVAGSGVVTDSSYDIATVVGAGSKLDLVLLGDKFDRASFAVGDAKVLVRHRRTFSPEVPEVGERATAAIRYYTNLFGPADPKQFEILVVPMADATPMASAECLFFDLDAGPQKAPATLDRLLAGMWFDDEAVATAAARSFGAWYDQSAFTAKVDSLKEHLTDAAKGGAKAGAVYVPDPTLTEGKGGEVVTRELEYAVWATELSCVVTRGFGSDGKAESLRVTGCPAPYRAAVRAAAKKQETPKGEAWSVSKEDWAVKMAPSYAGLRLFTFHYEAKGEKRTAVRIRDVLPDSPAAKAGLQPGDVVMSIDARKLEDAAQAHEILRTFPVGKTIAIGLRGSDVEITLAERPADPAKLLVGRMVDDLAWPEGVSDKARLVTLWEPSWDHRALIEAVAKAAGDVPVVVVHGEGEDDVAKQVLKDAGLNVKTATLKGRVFDLVSERPTTLAVKADGTVTAVAVGEEHSDLAPIVSRLK